MGFFARLSGVVNSFFQIGGPNGNGFNDVAATAVEVKDPTNTTFVVMRAANPAPGTLNDLTTKAYADTLFKPIFASVQFDGNNPLPANTVTEKFYVVTTTGANASIGQILWDDGSGVGTVHVIAAADGHTFVTANALTGGLIALASNSVYVWNATAAAWINTASATPGAVQTIDFPIALVNVSSTTSIPANAVILDAMVTITTPYSPGVPTISVGRVGNPTLLQAPTDNTATVNGNYDAVQRTSWGAGAAPVDMTLGGPAPAAGAGFITVQYVVTPNP